MNFYKIFLLGIFSCTISGSLYTSDSIVTFFFQKYPYIKVKSTTLDVTKYSQKLKQPSYMYKTITKHHYRNALPNVMCMYRGNVALSDQNGQITFKRVQQTGDMYILVTTHIIPAYIVAPATINNWVIDTKYPTKMYLAKQHYDQQSTLYYYDVQPVEIPHNKNIPLNTIIIIADPEYVYVPQGATIIDYSSNIHLPPILIKRGFCFVYNSLYTLAIKEYFRQTKTTIKQDANTVLQIEQKN